MIPRSISIALEHSETFDVSYHLARGLAYLTRSIAKKDLTLNDPPMGEGIVAIPLLLSNVFQGRSPDDSRLYDEPGRAERVAVRVAIWNSLLFLPLVGVVFLWCRRLYGARSGWLATALVDLDPNFAAHVPTATIDVFGVTSILIASFLGWLYFERPTPKRLVDLGVGVGASLMIKHTAVMLPALVLMLAALFWVVKPYLAGPLRWSWRDNVFGKLPSLLLIGLVTAGTIWALTLFELCPPKTMEVLKRATAADVPVRPRYHKMEMALRLYSPWPAGSYLRSFRSGLAHGAEGHQNYLFGETRKKGWWYYFPVVATYKIPIGIGVVFLLGILSVRNVPPRWDEWGLFLPFLLWSAFLMKANVNIGFRHFLFPYLMAIMLASRCMAGRGRAWPMIAWGATLVAGLHAAGFHPDYLSYINYPRFQPYLSISDSNVDWGQGLKQARRWIDQNPTGGRPVWVHYFGLDEVEEADDEKISYYLGGRARTYQDGDPPPTSGILIISPVHEVGTYVQTQAFKVLRQFRPTAVIGHALLVYDLDELARESRFEWPPEGRE